MNADLIVQGIVQHPWSLCGLHNRGRGLELAAKGRDEGRGDAELLQDVLKLRYKGDAGNEFIATLARRQEDLPRHSAVDKSGDQNVGVEKNSQLPTVVPILFDGPVDVSPVQPRSRASSSP